MTCIERDVNFLAWTKAEEPQEIVFMRLICDLTSSYKRLNSCLDEQVRMSSRHPRICLVAGILLLVVYTGRYYYKVWLCIR